MKAIARLVAAAGIAVASASPAAAQLPIQLSFNAGVARPMGNDADVLESGYHVGAGLKIILIPLQLEGSIDRMAAKGAGDDLTILGAAVTIPISITPPLSPIGVYGLAGGGMYNQRAGTKSSDIGVTAGAGIRINIPLLRPFAEARGISIFGDGNRLTYITLAVGLRF